MLAFCLRSKYDSPMNTHEALFKLENQGDAGGVRLQAVVWGVETQVMYINPVGEATMVVVDSMDISDATVTSGLKLVGAMRRHGLRRHLSEVGPTEIQLKDRVVLEDRDGSRVITAPIRRRAEVLAEGL